MGGGSRSRRSRAARRQGQAVTEVTPGECQGSTAVQHVASTAGRRKLSSKYIPTEEEVLMAVEILYTDRLLPYGRLLRKKVQQVVAETSSSSGSGTPCVDAEGLRKVCEQCELLHLEEEGAGEWSVVLKGRQPTFIDVCSSDDWYSAEMWGAAAAYFGSEDAKDLQLPSGRYCCAQALMEKDLPFLRFYSLGQVCHIVQLALTSKKLLGYLNGHLVPYERSQSMVKERLASVHQHDAKAGAEHSVTTATWDRARSCLREILEANAQGISLSNIKRFFREQFDMELSETALGYARLSDLMQDARFSDVCKVVLGAQGYSLHPVAMTSQGDAHEQELLQSFVSDGRRSFDSSPSSRQSFCPDEPLALEDLGCLPEGVPFIPTPSPSPFPATCGGIRAATSPALASATCVAAPVGSRSEPVDFLRFIDEPQGMRDIASMVHNTFIHIAPGLPATPTVRAKRRCKSVPRSVGCSSQEADDALSAAPSSIDGTESSEHGILSLLSEASSRESLSPRSQSSGNDCEVRDSPPPFCVDEPLFLEDDEDVPADSLGPAARTPVRLTPHSIKSMVRNTFIHAELLPTTPTTCARRRASSVPKGASWAHAEAWKRGYTPKRAESVVSPSPACVPPTPATVWPSTPLFPEPSSEAVGCGSYGVPRGTAPAPAYCAPTVQPAFYPPLAVCTAWPVHFGFHPAGAQTAW